MVSLPLMARLLDAVRPDSTLVLVGDPYQLASVEAGAVLGEIVGPCAADRETARSPMASFFSTRLVASVLPHRSRRSQTRSDLGTTTVPWRCWAQAAQTS